MQKVDWSGLSESAIVEAAKAGFPDAFDVLVRRYRAAAVALRREALDELPGSYVREPSWNRNGAVHTRPDVYRFRILSFLESLYPQ